jgi:hypothetical protein
LVSSKDELTSKAFPSIIHNHKNHKCSSERAILGAKNKNVDDLNFAIQNQIVGTLHSSKSIGYLRNEDEVTNHPSEYSNSLDAHGLPPHNLQLKVVSAAMMHRNLNQPKLFDGTRLVTKKPMINAIHIGYTQNEIQR